MKIIIFDKFRDYFISMGKNHRILLPVAIVGLALTMIVTNIYYFLKRSYIKILLTFFVVALFLLGNSFAFPILNTKGFVKTNKIQTKINVNESLVDLAPSIIETTDYSDIYISDEEFEATDEEMYSLDDLLQNYSEDEYISEGTNDECLFDENDWNLILINKQHPIPDNYEFTLGLLSGNMRCDERIINELLSMMTSARDDGVSLIVCSPYRDLERQEMLFKRKINQYMKSGYSYIDAYKIAAQAVTVPGSSEHQIGLAIDFLTAGYSSLNEGFKNTDAGKWLYEHSYEYGFILRYPEDKEDITGIEFEPWHYRYVGIDAATVIMKEHICLEEFWEKYL